MERHPLEDKFSASAWDILSAIDKGFRAQVDVKGKLAELYMDRQLAELKNSGEIDEYVWQDQDGRPDFDVSYKGHDIVLECKNIRSEMYKRPPSYKVELQKTRNSKDGTPTRGYKTDEFHVLGVCLFNQTGEWKFLYIATEHLECRDDMPDFLTIMQRVPIQVSGHWKVNPLDAFEEAI